MSRREAERISILVLGEAGAGKTTLISSLCGSQGSAIDSTPTSGCAVSMRATKDYESIQEFFDVCGDERFEPGRLVFYRAAPFDGIIFVHDLSDNSTRSALSRVWVPEAMSVYGDVKAIESGERHKAAGPHVSSRGVFNELRILWIRIRSKHSGINLGDAFREGVRLFFRYCRLVCNDYDIWRDAEINQDAERELLSTSTVPVAVIGLKQDIAGHSTYRRDVDRSISRNAMEINLTATDAHDDPAIASFLRRAAEHARRKCTGEINSSTSPANKHVSLPL